MAVVFSNNAKTTLASTVSTSATSITVVDGSVFPALNGADYTYVTLEDTSGNVEIVKVTALSSNVLTVVRAQDNTSARAFSSGDKCELRLTAAGLNEVASQADTDTNTTYSVGDGGLTQINFTSADNTKLDGIATSANNYSHPSAHAISFITGLQTALDGKVDDSQVLTNVPANALFTDTDTNTTYSVGDGGLTQINFTSADNTKLDGIETGATADQTAAQILTAIKTVDGSGSGLDADLLDGQHGSYYANESARSSVPSSGNYNTTNSSSPASLGTGYLRHDFWSTFGGGGSGYRSVLSISSYTSGSQWTQLAFNYNAGVNAPIYFRQNDYNGTSWGSWNQLWDSANDGSGSGLDADLLDGVQGSSFLRSDTTDTASGFISLRAGGDHLANHSFASASSTSTGYSDAGIEVREGNYGSTLASAPRIGMHWGGRVASNISMDASGFITIRNNPGTAYESFRANNIYANGTNLVWNTGNDGSGSGLDADLLDGYNAAENGGNVVLKLASNGYSQINNWTQVGGAGLYSSAHNSAHISPNSTFAYGTWKIDGSRGGYSGLYLSNGGGVVVGMHDAGGNGGSFNSTNGWQFYWARGNACLGVAGSTTSSSYGLYEQGGGIYSTGNITAYSDRRVKENIRTIDNALETVEKMRGVYYNRIDDEEKKTVIGFIAQEVDEVEGAKPLVTYAEDVDQYGVSYGNTAALLVEAIKDLSQQVKDLQSEIKEMKNA